MKSENLKKAKKIIQDILQEYITEEVRHLKAMRILLKEAKRK